MRTDLSTILTGGVRHMQPDNLQSVGSITKTDGADGSVLVKLSPDADADLVFDAEFLFVEADGRVVPMRMDDVTRRGGRSATVRLANVGTVAAASALVGFRVLAEDDDADADDEAEESIVGYEAVDAQAGLLGTVEDIDDSVPVNPLFVIRRPNGAELLVPAADEFVEGVDDEARRLLLRVPAGLLNIDEAEEV